MYVREVVTLMLYVNESFPNALPLEAAVWRIGCATITRDISRLDYTRCNEKDISRIEIEAADWNDVRGNASRGTIHKYMVIIPINYQVIVHYLYVTHIVTLKTDINYKYFALKCYTWPIQCLLYLIYEVFFF